MKTVIALLETHLDTCRNNLPIHIAEGDTDQAELVKETIPELEEAIAKLSETPTTP